MNYAKFSYVKELNEILSKERSRWTLRDSATRSIFVAEKGKTGLLGLNSHPEIIAIRVLTRPEGAYCSVFGYEEIGNTQMYTQLTERGYQTTSPLQEFLS